MNIQSIFSTRNNSSSDQASEYKTLARRITRHRNSLKYLTLKKLVNFLTLIYEIKTRKELLSSQPVFARINPISLCNLACPGCAIYDDKKGIKKYIRPKGMMSLDTYMKIIESLKNSLFQVVLYDEGEPLLNKNIWQMVKYTKINKIRTVISSNLSFKMTDQYIAELFDSDLDYLIIALDGVTQETYEKHRQGGDVELVKSNFERIMNYKKKNKKYQTEIEIQFIEFDYNIHEKEKVIAYAEKHGADVINSFSSYSVEMEDKESLRGRPRRHYGCFDIYAIADFDIDGSLFSCDFQEDNDTDSVGNINSTPFTTLWNSPFLRQLRKSFDSNSSTNLHPVCEICPITRGLPGPLL